MPKTEHPKNLTNLRFPSVEDIKASLGGRITRCGNRVLWSPNATTSAFRIEQGMSGRFRLRPYWQHPEAEAPYHYVNTPAWAEKCNWAYMNSVISREHGVPKSTVAWWRKRLGKE